MQIRAFCDIISVEVLPMLNEYSSGEIYIRHAVDERPDDRDFKMHIHDQCEIYLFISGNVDYLVEGSVYPLAENSLMIMSPAEAHRARILQPERYERYAVNFPMTMFDVIDPEGRLLKPFTERRLGSRNLLTADEIDMGAVRNLFSQMCENSDDYGKTLTLRTHIFMLADMISRAFFVKSAAESTLQTTAQKILQYVNAHLFEDISVSVLAEHFYLSTSQFSRVFKKATGAAPWEYITRKRLAAAKEKLRSGASAQSACESCGFSDYSAFYRAFVKCYGESPTSG